MKNPEANSLLDSLEQISDPRVDRTKGTSTACCSRTRYPQPKQVRVRSRVQTLWSL